MLSQDGAALAARLMTTLNKSARDVLVRFRVHACTDVTGFGFLGHACELAQGSGVQLEIDAGAIDCIPEALELARMRFFAAGASQNDKWGDD